MSLSIYVRLHQLSISYFETAPPIKKMIAILAERECSISE